MRRRSRYSRLAPVAAAVLVAVALSACSSPGKPSPSGAAGGATRTTTSTTTPGPQQVTFSPYTAGGKALPGLQVVEKVSGRCISPGVAGTASYRCIAQPDSVAYDPCFAPPLATSGPLLCVADPVDIDVVQFAVGALPAAPANTPQTRLWAMRLQNGEVCILVKAAWAGLGPFACPTPGATNTVADCHAPEHTTDGWSAACQAKENASSPFSALGVVNVWE